MPFTALKPNFSYSKLQIETLVTNANKANKSQFSFLVPSEEESQRDKPFVYILDDSNVAVVTFVMDSHFDDDTWFFKRIDKPTPINAYEVVVRSIVTISNNSDWTPPEPWQCYDNNSKDGCDTYRSDCTVKVTAETKEDAIEKAKSDAPGLDTDAYDVDVRIWVDEDQKDDVRIV